MVSYFICILKLNQLSQASLRFYYYYYFVLSSRHFYPNFERLRSYSKVNVKNAAIMVDTAAKRSVFNAFHYSSSFIVVLD